MEPMKPKRPILRWHGGKWILADWIISHFPEHRIYVEPYGGAASVLLQKRRSYSEVWNDLDQRLVNLFRVLQDEKGSVQLKRLLHLTPYSREEYRLSYEDTSDPVESARRLMIRCFMGFGSNAHNTATGTGFRANSSRSGTTPAHDWANLPTHIDTIVNRFRGVVLENKPALEVIQQHDAETTLHYIDPPYLMSSRSDARHDYAHEMSEEDHAALCGVLREVKGMVILSGYSSPLYKDLYAGWETVERMAYADGAKERTEVLWMNAAASKKELSLFR